jgi:nitroreductase
LSWPRSNASPGSPSGHRRAASAKASAWSVITDPERRRTVARVVGEEYYVDQFGPWISECAAQFVPCVSEEIYHRRYREPDKVDEDGREIDWPIPYWWVDVGATMQTIWLAAVNEGLGCGFVGLDDIGALKPELGVPDEFTPIGVMPIGRPLPDVRSPSLKRGWIPFEEFARWEQWG